MHHDWQSYSSWNWSCNGQHLAFHTHACACVIYKYICNICRSVKIRDAPHWSRFPWWCGKKLNVDLLLWCSLLHWQSICKGSYNGFSLLSPNPGGEAQRRSVPKDRHGCEEAEKRHRRKWGLVCVWGGAEAVYFPTGDHLVPPLLQVEPGKSDAWTKYMAEVKKYKAHQCGDDDKTRPLVK